MLRHTVTFKLKPALDSTAIMAFFKAAKKLAGINGVQNFECLKQVSEKNNFEFGLSMEFASNIVYTQYTSHPDHIAFVERYWLKNVEEFLEIDYEPLQ